MRTCAKGESITTTERETEMITTLPPMVLPSSVVVAVVRIAGLSACGFSLVHCSAHFEGVGCTFH